MSVIGYLRSIIVILLCVATLGLAAQEHHAQPGMGEGKFNYTSFTARVADKSPQVLAANAGHEQDPELGVLYRYAPCTNCYEALGKRTEFTKTFINKDTPSLVYTQTSTAPMHYRDSIGVWRSVSKDLYPTGHGVYAAYAQEVPVAIATLGTEGVTLGKAGNAIRYNNNLHLLYEDSTGHTTDLGAASWNNYTAGDDGVYVTDAWPGIDIELRTNRGAVKTNFWINRAMPAYATGKLLVREHMQLDNGLSLYANGQNRYTGVLEVRNRQDEKQYVISAATAFERDSAEHTLRNLEYYLGADNTVDIALPGDFLNRPASAYPVIIDPLVAAATSVSVAGSTYSPGWTTGCSILNPATVPPDITISDVQFTFEYLASGGALMANGSMDFFVGACRNPWLAGYYWYCLLFTPGTCGGANISLISDLVPCIPTVNCSAYDLNVTMNFYQNYATAPPCSNLYITATMPLTITVVGRVLNVTIAPTPAAICPGTTVSLISNTVYGTPPYSYSWSPGGATTSSISVTPAATTSYSVFVTDACGTLDTAVRDITVYPPATISGNTALCLGTTSVLYAATPGGTWVSSDTTIATIAATGEVTGIATGTATITYTTANGCTDTAVISIVSTPSAISGTTTLCTGFSASLTNSVPGGTWSSANPAIVTISSSGVITALTGGTSIITYAMSPSCYSIVNVTSFTTPAITLGAVTNPTTCISQDGSIVLEGLSPGNVFTVDYLFNGVPMSTTVSANAAGQLIISGLGGGIVNNIIATAMGGCISNPIPGPVALTLPPPPDAPVLGSNSPICAGEVLSLTATCATPGVTYSWNGPGGFTSALQNPVISPASATNAGAYSATTEVNGCISSPAYVVVVVHPIPNIVNISSTDPTACHVPDGTVTLSGLAPGVSYTIGYQYQSVAATPVTLAANAAGNVIVTGLAAGTYTNFTASSFGCLSAPFGSVVLADPGAPPPPQLSTNAPVCEGIPLRLLATDSMDNVTFTWTGPLGFTANIANPVIYNTTIANSGTYTAVATNGICDIAATIDVVIHPGVTLTNVTPDQAIVYGISIRLEASGAAYYMWAPYDGSLSDPNIRNPIARPTETTTYVVTGMNIYGCSDTAHVTITVTYTDTVLIPTAFTPNGDGHNDIFRIRNIKDSKLVSFDIFNRWGQVVFSNSWDVNKGWDGTYNGQPADMGVYYYLVIIARPNGDNVIYKGEVTLIR